ncbi:MAG: NifU family protein [Ehrlichia sp.]
MFIQIAETPNPNTLKFIPGMPVNNGKVSEFAADDITAETSSFATALFRIEHVKNVFFGGDFVSVTKSGDVEWDILKPEVLSVIMDFLTLNPDNAIEAPDEEVEEFFSEKDVEIVNKIKELIDDYIKPAVAQDGGDITFKGYRDGIVFVKLRGACSGCPSASITLKEGICNMLTYYIPDIKGVESI